MSKLYNKILIICAMIGNINTQLFATADQYAAFMGADVGAVSAIIETKFGTTFPSSDVPDLVSAVQQLADIPGPVPGTVMSLVDGGGPATIVPVDTASPRINAQKVRIGPGASIKDAIDGVVPLINGTEPIATAITNEMLRIMALATSLNSALNALSTLDGSIPTTLSPVVTKVTDALTALTNLIGTPVPNLAAGLNIAQITLGGSLADLSGKITTPAVTPIITNLDLQRGRIVLNPTASLQTDLDFVINLATNVRTKVLIGGSPLILELILNLTDTGLGASPLVVINGIDGSGVSYQRIDLGLQGLLALVGGTSITFEGNRIDPGVASLSTKINSLTGLDGTVPSAGSSVAAKLTTLINVAITINGKVSGTIAPANLVALLGNINGASGLGTGNTISRIDTFVGTIPLSTSVNAAIVAAIAAVGGGATSVVGEGNKIATGGANLLTKISTLDIIDGNQPAAASPVRTKLLGLLTLDGAVPSQASPITTKLAALVIAAQTAHGKVRNNAAPTNLADILTEINNNNGLGNGLGNANTLNRLNNAKGVPNANNVNDAISQIVTLIGGLGTDLTTQKNRILNAPGSGVLLTDITTFRSQISPGVTTLQAALTVQRQRLVGVLGADLAADITTAFNLVPTIGSKVAVPGTVTTLSGIDTAIGGAPYQNILTKAAANGNINGAAWTIFQNNAAIPGFYPNLAAVLAALLNTIS